jgi:hypothetical protein
VRGAVRAEGDRQRLLLERDRLAAVVERAERAQPFLRRYPIPSLERPAEQRLGGLVVEQDLAGAVDEEARRGQARQQVASEDQLERLVRGRLDG